MTNETTSARGGLELFNPRVINLRVIAIASLLEKTPGRGSAHFQRVAEL